MRKTTTARTQSVRDALEDDIVNGHVRPGERLDETSLSRRFKVSRTPVREALRQLSASGLIDIIPKRGAFVVELSLPRLIEMFEVMAELEGMCGRLCARRITLEERADLMASLEACRVAAASGESDDYYYKNEQFHDVIYRSCHNGFLIEQVQQLRTRLKPYRRVQLRVPRRIRDSFEEHEAIVDAILAGDEARVETCLKNHVLIQGERFTDLVSAVNANAAAETLAV